MDDKLRTDSFYFEFAPLSGADSRVLAFTCDEALGRPYTLSVVVDVPLEADLPRDVLGRSGTLRAAGVTFSGLVFESDLLLSAGDRSIHRLLLGPELRSLELGRHCRVFVDRSVPEILELVLRANGLTSYELRLTGSYGKRRHVCQYDESDLAFLHRWMQREGIYYYFLHDEGGKLVITDDRSRHEPGDPLPVRYVDPSGMQEVDEYLRSWSRTSRSVDQNLVVGGYDYLKPQLALRESRAHVAHGFEAYVRLDDNLQDPGDVRHAAAVRAERLAAEQATFSGWGNARLLHAGARFALSGHPRRAFDRVYQICRVVHHGSLLPDDSDLERALGLEAADEVYRVAVEALPSDVQYRPALLTPWPRIGGVESALIDGPSDSPYAQIDDQGRYRIRMLFDEAENPPGEASAWVRMAQPHGGAPEGIHLPLRKGTEVLVAFVQGDPDRPFILGAAPTPKTPSPVIRNNHTQNVLQTGGRVRIQIDDSEGQQYVDISAPPESTFLHLGAPRGLGDRNLVVSTKGDGLENVGQKRDLSVQGTQTEAVTGDVVENYNAAHSTHVLGPSTEVTCAGETQTISSGSTQTIHAGLQRTIIGGVTRTVNGAASESIVGARTFSVTGTAVESVGASEQQDVGGPIDVTTSGSFSLNASSKIDLMTPGAATLEGTAGVTIIAPGGHCSVDSWLDTTGQGYVSNFAAKFSFFVVRFLFHVNWLRAQAAQISAYGVKIDIKGGSLTQAASAEYFGVLYARLDAVTVKLGGATISPGATPAPRPCAGP
jgi:type VI secretion system secreted protein VgrG